MSWGGIAAAVIGAAGSIGGSLLSKEGGDSSASMTTPVALARKYWEDEIRKMAGIRSGETSPMELPEFQRMAGQANTQGNQSLQRMVQMLGQKGITGGAAGQAISTAQTGANQNILKMIQDIYSSANQRGNVAAGQLGSRSKQQLPQQAQSFQTPDLSNAFAAMFSKMGNQPSSTSMTDYYNRMYNNPQTDKYYQGW